MKINLSNNLITMAPSASVQFPSIDEDVHKVLRIPPKAMAH